MYPYKTVFVEAGGVGKNPGSMNAYVINGDQLAHDVQAAVIENDYLGFELASTENIISDYATRTYTQGVLLIFRKKQE